MRRAVMLASVGMVVLGMAACAPAGAPGGAEGPTAGQTAGQTARPTAGDAPVIRANAPTDEAAALRSAAPAIEGGRRLGGPEYRRLVFGNTLSRRTGDGGSMVIYVAPSGRQTLRLRAANGQSATDAGEQTVRDDRVCARWGRIGGGASLCYAYFLVGQEVVAVELSGQVTPTRFAVVPGNPEGL